MLLPPPHPGHSDTAFLPGAPRQNAREPFPPAGLIFRGRTHSLFFILFSSKGNGVAVGQLASEPNVGAWGADHWLPWGLRTVCGALVSTSYPFFSTPALVGKGLSQGSSVCQALGSDPGTCVVTLCDLHLGLATLKFLAPWLQMTGLRSSSSATQLFQGHTARRWQSGQPRSPASRASLPYQSLPETEVGQHTFMELLLYAEHLQSSCCIPSIIRGER